MDATGSGAEAKTKNMTNRGPKRRASSNNGYDKEENSENSDELLQLQWSNHSNAFGAAMSKLRLNETFCDVTLVSAKGEQFSAHKVVISACSTQLQSMLKPLPGWQHPVLLMPKDIPTEDLRDILAFMYSGEVHVERGRLQSFLQSAETLKVHGLCDTINPFSEFNKVQPENSNVESTPTDVKKVNTSSNSPVLTTKKIKRNLTPKPVTTTISPAFPPLRPSSRNSPKPGPSNRTTESPIAVKVEEPNFSDEENHPEHVVIPSDPNSIGEAFGSPTARHDNDDPIAAESCEETEAGHRQQQLIQQQVQQQQQQQNLRLRRQQIDAKPNLVLFSESARCHFCTVLCPDRATLKAHLEDTHQPPRHALCENCENFFHICAITRHRAKCMERYQQHAENTNTPSNT